MYAGIKLDLHLMTQIRQLFVRDVELGSVSINEGWGLSLSFFGLKLIRHMSTQDV
jgi:hypothetical protein